MSYIQLIIMAISLSMDAFSLAIAYGTILPTKKVKLFLSSTVGLFHYFMPLLGSLIGTFIISNIISDPDILVTIIFFVLSIEMIISLKDSKDKKTFKTYFDALLFAFSVSLDSFSIGIALGTHHDNIYIAGLFFSTFSAFFTYLGLNIGNKLSLTYGKIANIIGSLLLFILALVHLFT